MPCYGYRYASQVPHQEHQAGRILGHKHEISPIPALIRCEIPVATSKAYGEPADEQEQPQRKKEIRYPPVLVATQRPQAHPSPIMPSQGRIGYRTLSQPSEFGCSANSRSG